MKNIFRKRGTGKTTELILLSAKSKIPIVYCGGFDKIYIKEKAKELGVSIPDPVLYTKSHKITGGKAYIDDANYVLEKMLGVHIETLVISGE